MSQEFYHHNPLYDLMGRAVMVRRLVERSKSYKGVNRSLGVLNKSLLSGTGNVSLTTGLDISRHTVLGLSWVGERTGKIVSEYTVGETRMHTSTDPFYLRVGIIVNPENDQTVYQVKAKYDVNESEGHTVGETSTLSLRELHRILRLEVQNISISRTR